MMRVKNHTDFPLEKIREVVRFVKPGDVARFDVRVSNSRHGLAGTAYYAGSSYHRERTSVPFVVVRLTPCEAKFPRLHDVGRDGYLPALLLSREEALVFVMAHELRHLWQHKHPRGWRVWGARGRFSERDADAYAIRKVREWRRLNGG
jgi:hypothetical protein